MSTEREKNERVRGNKKGEWELLQLDVRTPWEKNVLAFLLCTISVSTPVIIDSFLRKNPWGTFSLAPKENFDMKPKIYFLSCEVRGQHSHGGGFEYHRALSNTTWIWLSECSVTMFEKLREYLINYLTQGIVCSSLETSLVFSKLCLAYT